MGFTITTFLLAIGVPLLSFQELSRGVISNFLGHILSTTGNLLGAIGKGTFQEENSDL